MTQELVMIELRVLVNDAQHRESFNLQTPDTRWEMALTMACLRKVCNDGQSHRSLVLSQPMLHKDLKCTKLLHQCLLSTLSLALRKHQSLFPKVVRCWTREGERKKAQDFFLKVRSLNLFRKIWANVYKPPAA